jgi:hypothetical protein
VASIGLMGRVHPTRSLGVIVRRLVTVAALAALVACSAVAAIGVAAAAPAAAVSAPVWSVLHSPHVPPFDFDTSIVFDPATGQLLAYDESGGCGADATWTWDGADWTSHQLAGAPQLRGEPMLGYDAATRQVIMFGGNVAYTCPGSTVSGEVGDTWAWNGSIWTQLHPDTAPSAREQMCAAYDEQTSQFIAFGGSGISNDGVSDFNETWSWTGATWAQLQPASTPPTGSCSMTYDAARGVIMMSVASQITDGTTQVWTWNGTTWSRIADSPADVLSVSYDYDTHTDIGYIGQGACTSMGPMEAQCTQIDQTWVWDGSAWSHAPSANNPEPGEGYVASYDQATHQYVIIGGAINFTQAVNDATLVYSSPGSSSVTPSRVFGADRQATATAVSQTAFPAVGSASAVVLARADVFADALAGGPLAAAKHGPLLLTSSASLDAMTKSEIQRVLPAGGTVYLLGGTSALSDAVAAAITAIGDVPVRVAGADRYGTAVAIAGAMGNPTTVFEASGTNFPDALSAVPAAVATHGAIVLTNGAAPAAATSAYLSAHATTRYAIGGPAAYADPSAIGIAGADRYATSDAVALAFFPAATGVAVASAASFPDALAGGPVAGTAGQPVLLVPASGTLPEPISSYLGTRAGEVTSVQAFGGVNAVTDGVLSEVAAALH